MERDVLLDYVIKEFDAIYKKNEIYVNDHRYSLNKCYWKIMY